MRAWYQKFWVGSALFLALLLVGCSVHNPLLGRWTFESYTGKGDLSSILGGLATDFSKGTIVQFTPKAMIVSQNGEKTVTPVDHYHVKGNKVEVWLKTSSSEMQAQTYVIHDHGRKMSRDVGPGSLRETFDRHADSKQ